MKTKAIILILLVAFVVIPTIATVNAAKTIVPFSYSDTLTATASFGSGGSSKWINDDHMRIARGTQNSRSYNGPLGVGTFSSESIISIGHFDNETIGYTTFQIHANYRVLLTITDGPYGTGTLEGIWLAEIDYNISRPTGYRYLGWGNATLQHGTGDLAGVRMYYASSLRQNSATTQLCTYTGEIVFP